METITLQYNPNSTFASALAALLRDAKDVSVMEKHFTPKRHRKTNYETTLEAIRDANEDKNLTSYASVDELFEKLGI